jgi:hypothetical protein
MLAEIEVSTMLEELWKWLHESGNLDILKLFGGFITTVIGGLWVFFTWIQSRKLDELRRTIAAAAPVEAPKSKTQNRSRKSARLLGPARLSAIIAGIVTIAGVVYGVIGYVEVADTATVQYKLCLGEYENNCGFQHDAYLYCYSDVSQWAKQRCVRYNATVVVSHDGNKCGYTGVAVACTQKLSK